MAEQDPIFKSGSHLIATAVILIGFVSYPARLAGQTQAADDADTPFTLATGANVDENLFALRMLAAIYANWPDLKQDRSKLMARFDATRQTASAMRGRIRARGLDPDLQSLYGDLLDYVSATESYLASLDLIAKQNSNQADWDVLTSAWDGYQKGSDAKSDAQPSMSPDDAADAGKLVGTAVGLYDIYSKGVARDAATQAAISSAGRKLEDQWNSTESALQMVSRRMTAKYGWAAGEAGFDGFKGNSITEYVNRSPRDPFLRAEYAEAVFDGAKNADNAVPAINGYLLAAELVPPDGFYNPIRLEYVEDAMTTAVDGAALDGGLAYSTRRAPYRNALKVTRTYLAMDPNDHTGFGHVELARALAFAGRYQEAAYSAQAAMNIDQNWRNDPLFCYRYAKLMALNGDTEQALSSIKRAYEVGFTQIGSIRTDPDLKLVWQQRPQAYAQLTTTRWSWNIKFGDMTPDSVVIQNDSVFDLLNPKLTVHVRQGQNVWDKTVGCARIEAGHSCQVDKVFFIAGNHIDEGTASLSSDQ